MVFNVIFKIVFNESFKRLLAMNKQKKALNDRGALLKTFDYRFLISIQFF